MIPREMVITSLALGGFVLLAGCYGLLYCAGRLRDNRALIYGAYAAYAAQVLVALGIASLSSLGGWWKLLIAASALAYLPIPPVTWRYLENLHQATEHS
ncbi:MAG TPA: hypothetical protein VFJ70_05210 [Burkholderiales bacterium]|nr:hypothetical protein [Burkholderiales bacterium]